MSWAGCKNISLGWILKIQVMKRRGALRLFSRSPDNTFTQTIKFCLVGLLNTAITAAVIFAFIHIGTGIYLSNFIGYAVGIAFSFVVNILFTFSTSLSFHRLGKFLLTCLIAYLVNVGVVWLVIQTHPSLIYSSQIAGMVTYTITGFLLTKLWDMK